MASYAAPNERTYRGFAFGHENPGYPLDGMAYLYPLTDAAQALIRTLRGKPVHGEYEVCATHEAEVRDLIDEMWELA